MRRAARSCFVLAGASVAASLLMTLEAEAGGPPALPWIAVVYGLIGFIFAGLGLAAWGWSHR